MPNTPSSVLRGNWQNLYTLTCIVLMIIGMAIGAAIDLLLIRAHRFYCTAILGIIFLTLGVLTRRYFLRKQAESDDRRRFHL